MSKIFLNNFIKTEYSNLYLNPKNKNFLYSDGDKEEKYIYQSLKKTKDYSIFSNSLSKYIKNWSSEYHFSEKRHNLLRHLKINNKAKILELGAGCGVITRQLGENGAEITAIEGSILRAKCAAIRCRDLSNVKVYCSNFQDVLFKEKYDLVLLIGVLEYSPLFFNNVKDPFLACLNFSKNTIKDNGKLIIAIENRLGFKYLLGYSEDHTGEKYIGIENLYPKKSPKTLDMDKLKNKLVKCGYKNIKFQFPFPDYKIPDVIFTQQAFETNLFNPSKIIAQYKFRDYFNNKYSSPFDENLFWSSINENNTIPYFSNSFLIISSLKDASDENKGLLAVTYNIERNKGYKTSTTFRINKNFKIEVIKKKILPKEKCTSQIIKLKTGKSKYHIGEILGTEMKKSIKIKDEKRFIFLCDLWLNYLIKNGIKEKNNFIFKSEIKPDFIDCIPKNIILSHKCINYIDKEWIYLDSYSLEMLILRGLYQFQIENKYKEFLLKENSLYTNFVFKWLNKIGLKIDISLVVNFVEVENIICDEVFGKNSWQPVRKLSYLSQNNIIKKGKEYFFSKLKFYTK